VPPPILVAGLDGRSLLIEAPVLQREGHAVAEHATARGLIEAIARDGARLAVLGPRLADLDLAEAVARIRATPATRHVSILALVPAGEPSELDGAAVRAGANAVLRRPLEQLRLESWIAKLLAVPRRIEARVPVHGHVVGTPKVVSAAHFFGLTRNISVHGMLLASPVSLADRPDLELELSIAEAGVPLKALGRVVREAPEVAWPYLGYGVEFLYVPDESLAAISSLVASGVAALRAAAAAEDRSHGIRVTLRREGWVYELLEPEAAGAAWQVEIRRAPQDLWRPGQGGPFYVVEGVSPEEALEKARDFVKRHT
jgi:CheY-like chemotaxis protein